MYSVRLVTADSYQAQPLPQLDPTFSEFRGSEIKHVPIIRIFGTTANGEKTCLHIHGVFPYLYVPYTGEEDPTSLAYRLSASLDAAINVSLGSASSNTQHVYLIQRVSGIPFYGYHRKEHQFLKIYFYSPAMIKRAADLLQNGSVLNQSLQPHEAHIPYILQFMMDYNVYGMSLVNLSSVKHRRLTQTLAELRTSQESTMSENSDIDYLPATIERQSTCEVEIDALASDIVNRRDIESGLELNPGLAAIWEEERARRAQAGFEGGDSQLVNPKSPPRPTFRPTDNDIYQEQRLARRLLMISQCDESSLSRTPNQSVAYAAEVKEGENLLNSSNLLIPNPIAERTTLSDRVDETLYANLHDSHTEEFPSHQKASDCSTLETEDAQLVDLLVQLAGGNGESQDSIDLDSLLGAQLSALRNGEKSDNEEEDDDSVDLNLTSLQLDSVNSLDIPAEQANAASQNEENKVSPTVDLREFILSDEISISSRSEDGEKTTERFQVPQYDGAGDISPTLLNSDDEDNNDRHPREFSHLTEFNGGCDPAAQSQKFDNLDDALKLPSNASVTTKNGEKNAEPCCSPSLNDAALQSSTLPPVLVADELMMAQYHNSNYEPLDRLLEIGPDFAPDLEGLHSSMEIGILLSSADSDTPESVDEAPEDEVIPLETVLNGDPCFTESAELDKSDLTELQDQYVSLFGNSLLPDVHTNLRIDSDLGNSSNFSDHDYQSGEKTCEILLNVRSPRSLNTSRQSSSSSENVAPNIQEPEARNCAQSKFNYCCEFDRDSWNCKDFTRISTDNPDYNCNVVATWAELQNLQFVEKEKMEGRLGRSKDRGQQHSQGPRQIRRRAIRRSDERAANQILRLDSEKVTNVNTSALLSLQDAINYSLSPRKIMSSNETKSPIKITFNKSLSPIAANVTILEKKLEETLVNIVEEKFSPLPRVPDIAAKVELEQQTSFDDTETCSRLDSSFETTLDLDNDASNADRLSSSTPNATEVEDNEESPENRLNELNESPKTKEILEGYSYYSSERSECDYKTGGFAHWHCQLMKGHKIVQEEVFTSDQVWVIEKRKRGRQPSRICGGVCMRSDCRVPIVLLKKIVNKSLENSTIVSDSLKVEEKNCLVEEKTEKPPEKEIQAYATDSSAKKRVGPKNRSFRRKSRVQRDPIDYSSSDSNDNENKKKNSIELEPSCGPIPGNKEETNDRESSEPVDVEDVSSANECLKSSDSNHNPYVMKRRYSRKKRSRIRNSKRMISIKNSRTTINGLLRRVTRFAKHENDNSLPGVEAYRSDIERSRPRKGAFTSHVSNENMTTETPRKTKNKIQPVLCNNWECKREISRRRPNALVNCVENGISADTTNVTSLNSTLFDIPPVSPIPKRDHSPHDNSKNNSSSINRASTPKKLTNGFHSLTKDKVSECVALELMIHATKSRSTRAKLKLLLEQRRDSVVNNFRDQEENNLAEKSSLSSEKPLDNSETQTPIAGENPELPHISLADNSTKMVEVDSPEEDNDARDDLEASFETVTDVSEKMLEPKVDSTDEIVDSSTVNAKLCTTENTEASGLFEPELEVLENSIPGVNRVEELFNERKELSYRSEQFMTTTVENNFYSGNNYTIDAVSLEIPACLFEEDSNSVDKRSPRKIGGGVSKISSDLQNTHDIYSDTSVDCRDLDVYDADSLTPSSSLANLNDATLDGTEMSLNFSETTKSSIVENSTFSESPSVNTSLEKSGSGLKSEGILDSSFEEASPEFEALSPNPKTCDLIEPSKEEFAVHSTVAILETERDFDDSMTCTIENSRTGQSPEKKVSAVVVNSELDHEIQDLVSQVVEQIENKCNLSCESESFIIEVLESVLDKNSEEIVEKNEIPRQTIGKPDTLETRTEREKKIPIETESQIKFEQIVAHKLELKDERIESKGENKESKACLAKKSTTNNENDFLAATQNDILSDKERESISKNACLTKRPNCRPVSIKLVNIDLTRFQGFRLKNRRQNCPSSSANNIVKENVENMIPVEDKVHGPTKDDDKDKKSRKTSVNWESSTSIGIEAIPKESGTPFQIPHKDAKIVNTIPVESVRAIGTSEEGERFEKITPKESSEGISDDSETFEIAMPTLSPQNLAENETEKMSKRARLPARRSGRKCAEKTRRKLSQQAIVQLSSAESSWPSAEASEIVTENDSLKPEPRLHKKSDNLLTHEITIPESELNTVCQSLKFASSGVDSSYSTEEKGEEEEEQRRSPTVDVKVQQNSTKKRGTENSLECVLPMPKLQNENKAPYVTWGKRCRSEDSSQENSRDTSPEINESIEEHTSADENIKPDARLHVYSRKCFKRYRRKPRPVPPQLKLALQKRALKKQAFRKRVKISSDSQILAQQMPSDTTDQENHCSLYHRLTAQNIVDSNTEEKDSVSSDEKSRDHGEKIRKLRSRQTSPKTKAQDVLKTNAEGIHLSPEKNAMESPDNCVGSRRRRRVRKISSSSDDEPCLQILSSQEKSTHYNVEKTFEMIEEFSLPSQIIGQEDGDSKNSKKDSPDSETFVKATKKRNLPNEKSSENITEQISQELESSSPKIPGKIEQETCVKTKKKGRPRKVLEPKIEGPSTVSVLPIVIKNQNIDGNKSDNSEISGYRVEPEIHVKVKKRGRPRKILASNSLKLTQSPAKENTELDEENFSKSYPIKINEEDVKSKISSSLSFQRISVEKKCDEDSKPLKQLITQDISKKVSLEFDDLISGNTKEEKSFNETRLPRGIIVEVEKLTPAIPPRENGRVSKIIKKAKPSTEKNFDRDSDIADANSQEFQSLLSRIMEERVKTESRKTNKKGRQECTSSSEEIIVRNSSLKLSSEKLDEADTESRASVVTTRRSRTANKSEVDDIEQEVSQVGIPKKTEKATKPKVSPRNMKRTRSEMSPEAKTDIFVLSEQVTEKIFSKTLSEPNLSPQKISNDVLETQSSERPQKRVRFDEDSIRDCTEQLTPKKLPVREEIPLALPNKDKKKLVSLNHDRSPTDVERSENNLKSKKIYRTTRATAVNLSQDVIALKDQQQQTKNLDDPDGNNGVAAKFECTISSSDNESLDLQSLQKCLRRHRRHQNIRGFSERTTKSSAQKQQSQEMQQNDSKLSPMKKMQFSTNTQVSLAEPTRCRSKTFVLNQEPTIILQRLSLDTLKIYGFEYKAKTQTFVKNLKKHRPDADYQIPAYDGPADFSSSESDEEPADITVAREEKRVCVYQSGKKTTNTRKESVVTPGKRKFEPAEDPQSPTSKHRAIATPGPSSKASASSPNRTSMLKSPGRTSGYYPSLPIIITSPKVRKETSKARNADDPGNDRDIVSASTSSACITPRRKNEQRLHENLLRARISAMKSPKNVIGDKRATPVTMGSQRPGELDEIKSSKQRERIDVNIDKSNGAAGNHNFTSTLRDGKDVRKKLVFSTVGHESHTDQIPNKGLDHQSTNIPTSSDPIEHPSIVHDARKSLQDLENLVNQEITALDPQPGPSHADSIPIDENMALYEVTTDDDSQDDDECNVTFTQYIVSQIERNHVLTLDRSKITDETKKIVSLRPKFNPPNSQRIIDTMESYGIPKYRNQEPFFSNEADVSKQKELAQKMLKVPGKGLKDLAAFISSVEGITGIARWRKMKINELQPALAKSTDIKAIRALVGNDVVSVTPLIKPPTQKDVRNWLRARNYLEKKQKKAKEQAAKKSIETRNIEIQGKIAKSKDEECGTKDLDLSVIEGSPEKTVGGTDSGNMENSTLKMKLAKRGLSKKSEDLKGCRLISSESEQMMDSVKASVSEKGSSVTENTSSTEIEPSLLSVLEKSDLFKNQEASRHLGVSRGQIEFLSESTRSNVANENLQNAKALTRYQYLTIMCLEVHVSTRGDLLPDAQYDSISAIFYSVQSDVPPNSNIKPLEHGVIVVADEEKAKNKMYYSYASKIPWSISFANNEEALLNALVTLITRTDPEILIGWELETLSWGYVFQRATRLGMNLSKRISRIPATQCKWETAAPDIESMAEVKLPGRIVLDIWRMMRAEAALLSYTFESVMHHVLNERVPCPSFKILTDWWNLKRVCPSRWRVIEHYSIRVLGVFRMLDQLDIIGRTSELARLFGIQFYEVFSRGSQYRVESVMLRLAKPLNYIAVSPTPLQRASMRAMEALPLILEPESKFYSDPLIVLDFQSLYPSIIIAHNYCFSTCLGRIEHIGQPQPFEFGAYTLRVSKNTALKLQGKVNYAPCGVAYVKPEVRLGILPRMLTEILETRFMVKKAMKDHKQGADKTLQRALHSRQHGLKFLANVTYGYTAANFSGRMPCIEVGDSVISKSKETLERAIKLVESTPKWGARVVYGDTDSLFILVPGKSKADAFVIGNEIADAVTASNPPPIKLKFEKVMYPSILQTKKRYCGYMYETPDQETPTYLAKGIETVRRDGCPAVSKILEKTLKILFDTKDVSLVKMYVTRQLDKVLRGKVSIQDLTFAKEFRGLKGYKAKACVPALELTRRLMRKDPRAVPRNSERVRYVIVAGAPNQALIHCVRTPWELINDPGLKLNAIYYVTRVIIPPLNRCLNLMGVDVNAWYREMPHRQILHNPVDQPVDKQKLTIFQYFGTIVCVSCGEPSNKGICAECLTNSADTLVVLQEKLRWLHRNYDQVTAICQSCVGQRDNADCSSLECPVLYRRAQAHRELSQATHLRSIIECGNTLEF